MSSIRRGVRIVILDSSSDSDETNSFGLVDTSDDDNRRQQQDDSTRQSITKQMPILIDSSDEMEGIGKDENLESCLKALTLSESRRSKKVRGRVPFKSQLSSLNFGSSEEESDDMHRTTARNRKVSHRRKARKSTSVIELLDTDSELEELSNGYDSNVSNDAQSTLQSPTASPEVFQMKTSSPCNSALSISDNEVQSDDSCSMASELLSIDGDNGTVWRRNKLGNYVLKGECLISGNSDWPKMNIPKKMYDKLYDHQKSGVQFLASLYSKGVGGILGDDMGLGKTFQTCTLLAGLMRSRTISSALIVCPVAVMKMWEREAQMIVEKYCGVRVSIRIVDSSIRRERRAMLLDEALRCPPSHPTIVITSYGLVKSSRLDFLAGRKDDSCYWDYVITDEGHQLKNPNTEQHKAIARVARSPRTHRLLLTGTPIQNNMKELWALFDWATSGKLFGPQKRFLNQYAIAIEGGRSKDATRHTLRLAEKANKELQEKLRPHFLQRMKNSEFKDLLPVKKELVVWTHLSDLQREKYQNYVVDGGKIAAILSGEISSPLVAITWLKKLCDHPSLVDKEGTFSPDPDTLINNSSKLNVLVNLVQRLKRSKHRCLIFSPSTKMLDIMEKVLPLKLGRIDGSTKGKDRQGIVDLFNQDDESFDALLLSTKAAGVGLTLTGADRAIIFSPSWNPADDSQAVDRCYRIGQRNNVTIYRFITAGTVEEHMYARQVEKDGIRRTLMTNSGSATERHFSKNDLKRLFYLSPKGECQMLDKIKNSVQNGAKGSSGLRSILEKHDEVVGVSSHDLVYQNNVINLVQPEQSPFGGTTLKKVSSRGAHFTPRVKLDHESMPLRSSTLCNTHRGGIEHGTDTIRASSKSGKVNIDQEFKRIEELSQEGDIAASLTQLFQLLESKNTDLQGADKLRVHKMIASRILYFGWNF